MRRKTFGDRLLLVAGLAAVGALVATSARAQDDANIRVRVNGERVFFNNTRPMMVNGRVLVPLRGVLEHIGANVDWLPADQTVIASRGDTRLQLPIGSHTATVNGREVRLDTPAVTIGGSTMVPLRFVSEALGADVGWSNATETVMIETRGDRSRAAMDNEPRREVAPAEYQPGRRADIASGTVVPVTLDTTLSSDGSRVGERFTATVREGDESAGLPRGTRVQGVVSEAIPARNGRPGVLSLDIRRVIFPDGFSQPVEAAVTSLDSNDVRRTPSGRLMARSGSNEQGKWIGIGAGAGLLIGTATHGNLFLDTLMGGGAGYLYNQLRQRGAYNVRLDQGTEFGVRFTNRFAYDRNRT